MIRIILVRHGETRWNKECKFQGRMDIELNENGLKQGKAIADALKNVKIDAIYSSPLKRSFATAEMIAADHNIEIVGEPSFNEIDHGFWEGLTVDEVNKEFGDLYQSWLTSPEKAEMPEGESLEEVRRRAIDALEKILAKHKDGETILIVAHDAINKVIILHALELDNSHFWQVKQGNASIDVLEYEDGNFMVTLVNDTCHLGGVIDDTTVGAL